jgi:hypothetical protein
LTTSERGSPPEFPIVLTLGKSAVDRFTALVNEGEAESEGKDPRSDEEWEEPPGTAD